MAGLPVATVCRSGGGLERAQAAEAGGGDLDVGGGHGDVALKDDFLRLVVAAQLRQAFM